MFAFVQGRKFVSYNGAFVLRLNLRKSLYIGTCLKMFTKCSARCLNWFIIYVREIIMKIFKNNKVCVCVCVYYVAYSCEVH